MRRPVGHYVVIALFTGLALSALNQVRQGLLRETSTPVTLVMLHVLTGALSTAVAFGVYQRARWTTGVIAAWGIAAAGMVVLLEPILALGSDARSGLLGGAAVIAAIAFCAAWYVRRDSRQSRQ